MAPIPGVVDVITAGVGAAKDKARGSGYPDLKVGCNTSPLFGPSSAFFSDLTRAGGERFVAHLDYIGLDFFPDVFRPIRQPTWPPRSRASSKAIAGTTWCPRASATFPS